MKEKTLTKADLSAIIERIANLFRLSITPGLVADSISKFYDKGLNDAELSLNMNFTRDPERINLLSNYTVGNIKDLNEDTIKNIRQVITRGVVNLESNSKIASQIKELAKVSGNRARMIARTEMNRAENVGHIDGARQSGLNLKKQWDAHLDKRTSAICKALNGQIIPLDSKFKYDGKEFDAPPSHPNCRSTLLFIQQEK